MSIELVDKFASSVDELFSAESKLSLLTNKNYDWDGAHAVKVYSVSTAQMNNYDRNGSGANPLARYGAPADLDATTQTMTLGNDRSFAFVIDKADQNETGDALQAATALARQQREVVIPEVDSYVYGIMATNAGTKPAATSLSSSNIYSEIIAGQEILDNNMVPETDRVLVVCPAVYALIKQNTDLANNGDIGEELRRKGVVGMLDGMTVVKVPATRLPVGFGFMIAHPSACVAPVKLASYKTHQDPPGINGCLCEGRVIYDAFVLNNKKNGIYYQAMSGSLGSLTVASAAGSASGDTAITVSPALTTGNQYRYKVGNAATSVSFGDSVKAGWTAWDGSSDITAATDKVITIVEANSLYKAVKEGHATVVAKA